MDFELPLNDTKVSYFELLSQFAPTILTHSRGPNAKQWEQCESELGFKVPQTFREIVTLFGNGSFGDRMTLCSPLERKGELECWDYQSLKATYDLLAPAWEPYTFYPEPNGLLVCATFNVRTLMCFDSSSLLPLGSNERRSVERIILIEDDETSEVLNLDFSEVLYRILFNRPALTGPISGRLHALLFDAPNVTIPIFLPRGDVV